MYRVRLVTFDARSTLIHFKEPVGEVYARFAHENGLGKMDPASVTTAFDKIYRHHSKKYPCFGGGRSADESRTELIGPEKWWSDVVQLTLGQVCAEIRPGEKPDQSKLVKTAEILYAYFDTINPWILDPHAEDTLKFLRSRGLILGVISNYDLRLRSLLSKFGISSYFKFLALSGELGFEKPDEKIFKFVENLTKVHHTECLHVGDHLSKDYLGAKNAGWQAALLKGQNEHVFKNDKRIIENDLIETIAQLKFKIMQNF